MQTQQMDSELYSAGYVDDSPAVHRGPFGQTGSYSIRTDSRQTSGDNSSADVENSELEIKMTSNSLHGSQTEQASGVVRMSTHSSVSHPSQKEYNEEKLSRVSRERVVLWILVVVAVVMSFIAIILAIRLSNSSSLCHELCQLGENAI